MPPADATDKTKDHKKDGQDEAAALSREVNDPKAKKPADSKGHSNQDDTSTVPKATVTLEGSIFFNAYNRKLQEAGLVPEIANPIEKPANVKVDNKGHVTEVTLPNEQKRTFGYDQKGELSSINEPNGKSYSRGADGKWVDAQGHEAPFDKPAVSSTGDLVFTTRDGRIVTEAQDGKTTALNPRDNSVVTYDANFHVTNVHYADGKSRSFTYDNGTLTSVTDTDGQVTNLQGNKWLAQDGSNTYRSDVRVLPDGTFSYREADGKTISTSTSGEQSLINQDGSVCRFDSNHRITEITYSDGNKTQFGYDAQGNANQIITRDGKTLTLQDGKWLDAQQHDTGISDLRVQPDGSFWFQYNNKEFINSTKGTQLSFDREFIAKAARDLHEAKDHSTLLVFSSPETEKILNILEPMSAAERQLVMEEYARQNPGHDLAGDLREKLSGPDAARAEALLKRVDGVADNTGQIHQALAKLVDAGPAYPGYCTDDQVRAEKEVRDALNTLTADQLKAVEAKYKQDYGRDLWDDLLKSENISEETKAALQLYAKGCDNRTDEDILAMADLALTKGRPDLFDEIFRDAPQSARDKFISADGMKRIEDSFWGGDVQIAKDYLQRGCVSIATIVDGDTHWYHTNKDDITRAVTNASPQDREEFKRGEDLVLRGVQPPYSSEDQRAIDFYKSVDRELHEAGNDREASKWKAQLRNNEQLIVQLLDAHSEGHIW